ncbi:MAG: HAD hydrolase-like protein [Pygmaiobacter massiliensis]|nr:HAD hydrolase-like protein [Pygmaiobacter massiliensis]
MNFKAVLFDLDGTIADTAPGILHSMQLTLERFGIHKEQDSLRRHIGPPLAATFAEYLPKEQVPRAIQTYREYYLAGEMYKSEVYEGMRELIIALYEDGCKVCLATAKPRQTACQLLDHWGLTPYFAVIGGVEEEKGIDTKAKVIANVLRQLEIPAEKALMVGDRQDDLKGAAACGVPACGAAYGYAQPGELEALCPFCTIRKPLDLLPIVEGDFLRKGTQEQPQPACPPKKRAASRRVLWVAGAALLLLLGLAAAALFQGKKPAPGADEFVVTPSQTVPTVLPETADAGQSYVDNTLFVGDSNTVRLYNFGQISLQNMLGYVGIGIGSVIEKECIWFEEYSSPATMPQAVKLLQPGRIVMMFGTNDTYLQTDDFIAEYSKVYDALHTACPSADIIIASVPPIGKGRSSAAVVCERIADFNEALAQLAAQKGAHFLNVYETLADEDGFLKSEYSESDGLHLTEKGAQALIEYLRCHSLNADKSIPVNKNAPTRIQTGSMPSESEATAQWDQNQQAAQQPDTTPVQSQPVPNPPAVSTPALSEPVSSAPAESTPAGSQSQSEPEQSVTPPALSEPEQPVQSEQQPAQSQPPADQ